MAVTRVTDLTKIMLPGYLFAIVSFILLALQKRFAVILLIISGAYSAFIEYQWMRYDVFSLVVLLLFMYHVIIVVTVYVEQIPERLKQKELAKKKEEDEWRGKI
jgi:amino acid permease